MALFEDDLTESANNLVIRFCRRSNNSDADLLAAANELRALELSRDQLSDIRMCLPVHCGGTAEQRVLRIDRALKRLEKELT